MSKCQALFWVTGVTMTNMFMKTGRPLLHGTYILRSSEIFCLYFSVSQ